MTKRTYIIPEQFVVDFEGDMDTMQSISNVDSGNGDGWGTGIPIIGGDPQDEIREVKGMSYVDWSSVED
ncbi:MAG: hypothetical protein MJZ60_06940 [Bacteroidaceae bacterium]|nr:hypothetical protein [Bacteroidaceae bacterium]